MQGEKAIRRFGEQLKKGFTIIELMVVIAVIGILVTLVTKAATSSVKEARVKNSQVMASTIKMGIASYRAYKGEWPGVIETYAEQGRSPQGNSAKRGALSPNDADAVVQEVVKESGQGNPLLDVSGLFVANKSVADARQGYGLRYTEARKQNVSLANMAFGYQRKRDGVFRRFLICYDPTNDTVSVERPEE